MRLFPSEEDSASHPVGQGCPRVAISDAGVRPSPALTSCAHPLHGGHRSTRGARGRSQPRLTSLLFPGAWGQVGGGGRQSRRSPWYRRPLATRIQRGHRGALGSLRGFRGAPPAPLVGLGGCPSLPCLLATLPGSLSRRCRCWRDVPWAEWPPTEVAPAPLGSPAGV